MIKHRAASPVSNDYTGLKQLKANNNNVGSGAAAQNHRAAVTITKPSSTTNNPRRTSGGEAAAGDEAAEQRSIHAEQDYKRKDAVRHIVVDAGQKRLGAGSQMNSENLKLMKLLTNLECVRKGKPMERSEIGSIYSRRSHIS